MKTKIITTGIVLTVLILILLYILGRDKQTDQLKHQMLVQHVESLGKLELVRYTIQDVVEYEKYRNWLPNSKTLLVVFAEAVGCIDLTKLTAADIYVKNDSVSIQLPYPELCYCKVDHQRSRVYQVEYGLWETANLVDDAYRYAENQFYAEVHKTGMDVQVKANTRKVLEPILQAMGFKKIHLDFHTYMPKQMELQPENNVKK